MRTYPFIAFEGIDGAGKTTLRALLHRWFVSRGYPCFVVGQHSWLNISAAKTILDVRRGIQLPKEQISEAYCIDKALHWKYNIMPTLERRTVIADRFIASDCVYMQALYRIDADETFRKAVEKEIGMPDLTFFVDVEPEIAVERIQMRGKLVRHYERVPELSLVRNGYLNSLGAWSREVCLIDTGNYVKPESLLETLMIPRIEEILNKFDVS